MPKQFGVIKGQSVYRCSGPQKTCRYSFYCSGGEREEGKAREMVSPLFFHEFLVEDTPFAQNFLPN